MCVCPRPLKYRKLLFEYDDEDFRESGSTFELIETNVGVPPLKLVVRVQKYSKPIEILDPSLKC